MKRGDKVDAYIKGSADWWKKRLFSPPNDPILFKFYCSGWDGIMYSKIK